MSGSAGQRSDSTTNISSSPLKEGASTAVWECTKCGTPWTGPKARQSPFELTILCAICGGRMFERVRKRRLVVVSAR
ncbi:hypothetical protein DFJ74DRAFT_701006 [Hyaloraphidium curvatum]|nr:hypothetical protein DFJ74DRAFT_701006 [Hyaloraphidium curvatum]